ncbi:MAG: ASCH domain-containing protein [Alphaproteobacteria bacterium]|nr:ASCH domain-containing protein [Alphaproteobacteria bacterium]
MAEHTMHLKRTYFDLFLQGKKTVELRLLDEKRKKIQLGDTIRFICNENENESFIMTVIGLVVAKTFNELLEIIPVTKCGFPDTETAVQTIEQFCPSDKQDGVLGIVLRF